MKKLTISLIIPAYNEEKYIGDCLSHALHNAKGAFLEIIVIDNASTDNTAAIVRSFPGVKIVHEKEKGLTKARQRGFKEAQGDILAYIDADTRMPELWPQRILHEFESDEKTACVSGPYVYYDSPKLQQLLTKMYWYFIALPMYHFVGYMAVGGNFAIRKSILEQMNGFDTSISFYGEDTNIARRASSFGNVLFRINLLMPTSGRRFNGQGFIKTSLLYMANFVSEAFYKKPVTKEYQDIR